MRTFDFYEFAGVLCPGVVLPYSAALIIPEFAPIPRDQSVFLGDLGLFSVLMTVATFSFNWRTVVILLRQSTEKAFAV